MPLIYTCNEQQCRARHSNTHLWEKHKNANVTELEICVKKKNFFENMQHNEYTLHKVQEILLATIPNYGLPKWG